MVIARACLGDRSLIAILAQRTDLDGRRDLGHRLQRGSDIGAGELVVSVAALGSNAYQTTIDKLAKVSGGGRGRDPCATRKLTGEQPPAVGQRGEHRRASGVAEQRSDRREIGLTIADLVVSWHGHSMPRRRFTPGRNVSALPSGKSNAARKGTTDDRSTQANPSRRPVRARRVGSTDSRTRHRRTA